MSVIKSVRMACDHPDCADDDESAGAFPGHETAATIRHEAKKYGWTRRRGKDYCPDHSGGTEATE
jgi:hypothetical protein